MCVCVFLQSISYKYNIKKKKIFRQIFGNVSSMLDYIKKKLTDIRKFALLLRKNGALIGQSLIATRRESVAFNERPVLVVASFVG